MILNEGGNAIPDSIPVPRDFIPIVVKKAKGYLPKQLLPYIQTDIGSAGYKAESGDIDIFVDAEAVVKFFKAKDEASAKKALEAHFKQQGLQTTVKGRNVHIGVPFPGGLAQVDVMVIADSSVVAPWHQHGPRGSYNDPEFKGNYNFILMNSIGKALGLKFDAFGAKLMKRDNNEVVARNRDEVAKILLGPNAGADDLNSVKSMMAALRDDPHKEEKLAQARDDAKQGKIKLPESVQPGSATWFRSLSNLVGQK